MEIRTTKCGSIKRRELLTSELLTKVYCKYLMQRGLMPGMSNLLLLYVVSLLVFPRPENQLTVKFSF